MLWTALVYEVKNPRTKLRSGLSPLRIHRIDILKSLTNEYNDLYLGS